MRLTKFHRNMGQGYSIIWNRETGSEVQGYGDTGKKEE
jgi:hypothetical protein